MVAERGGRYSLSCNPDLTLDVAQLFGARGKKLLVVGVVHPDLPFLDGEAEVGPEFFGAMVKSDEVKHQLFALPRQPISLEDHLIGLHSSQFVRDGGTLQIGIGSLSDAVVNALCWRQQNNDLYKNASARIGARGENSKFAQGLYGLTEMLTDGFMHLRTKGILRREVADDATGMRTYLHGSFILGSKPFYEWLRRLPAADAKGLRMTRVSKVNDLYDPQETKLRQQRVHPRFFNTTMQVSLLGEAMSETLPDGKVISGVGGQYNFVAMAHELKDSRSIIMLRATRIDNDGQRQSNIVWAPGHVTIPRHLRDVVVTEYGVADLLGKSDEECIIALLNITDSDFQQDLADQAMAAGKLRVGYAEWKRGNTPRSLREIAEHKDCNAMFKPFPFGSDFTAEEEHLALALGLLSEEKKISVLNLVKRLVRGGGDYPAHMERMGLAKPRGLKEHLYRRLLAAYLGATDEF